MAKKLTSQSVKVVDPDDLKRAVGEILRQKESAAEYVGLAGQATKQAIERLNLDRKALGVIVALKKADDEKRQATLRSIIQYADAMGFFDQMDAFGDLSELMGEIAARKVETAKAGRKAATNDAAIAAMVN